MITGILMSLDKPQWGIQANQGPPDLEDLWRDFNNRLSSLFGKRRRNGAGDGPGAPPPPINTRAFGGGIGALTILVLLVWLASGFYIVDASERGIVLTFGKYSQTTDPGLRWRLPYPFQSHEIVKLTEVRIVEIGYRGSDKNSVLQEALMLTDDENIVSIQFAIQWILKNPEDYLFNDRYPDKTVLQAAETAMREVVGKTKMDFVLYEGREEVANQASELMQEILDRYGTGILVSKLTLQNVQPPEQVQAAFDDAVKAGQDRDRQVNEGQAYANDVIPRARGTASRLEEEASAYQARVVANAEGEANRFKQILTEYRKAPEVTRKRMYLDTVEQMLSNTSKVMLDTRSSNNLLYLPLDKLIQSTTGQTVAPGSAEPRSTFNPGTGMSPLQDAREAGSRSRDSLRSRERESR